MTTDTSIYAICHACGPTDADRALALMHPTPDDGLSVFSGKTEMFDAIPCEHWVSESNRLDIYAYDNGDEPTLYLAIRWEGESFYRIKRLPKDAY